MIHCNIFSHNEDEVTDNWFYSSSLMFACAIFRKLLAFCALNMLNSSKFRLSSEAKAYILYIIGKGISLGKQPYTLGNDWMKHWRDINRKLKQFHLWQNTEVGNRARVIKQTILLIQLHHNVPPTQESWTTLRMCSGFGGHALCISLQTCARDMCWFAWRLPSPAGCLTASDAHIWKKIEKNDVWKGKEFI